MQCKLQRSGLYTLQFSYVSVGEDQPKEPLSPPASGDPILDKMIQQDHETRQLALKKQCATMHTDWMLLCRLLFEGEMGRVKGSVKVRHGVQQPDSSSSGSRACLMPDCQFFPNSNEIRLMIHFDRLDGFVLGLKSDLNNVTVKCVGVMAQDGGDWAAGTVTVLQSNNLSLKLGRRVRFLLKTVSSPRCGKCLDPVDAVGFVCNSCGAVEYCSKHCQETHATGHSHLCSALKLYCSPKSGRVCATFAGVEFLVYWRCVDVHTFDVLVDFTNPLGRAYEMQLSAVKDAREGLDYRYIGPSSSSTTSSSAASSAAGSGSTGSTSSSSIGGSSSGKVMQDAELNELNITVFRALAIASLDDGCTTLTAACLNQIFTWSESIDSLAPLYSEYYYACVGEQFEGMRQISCLTEYVTYVRPMFECAQIFYEWALKAPMACFFWQRISIAKEVLINLYNFNSAVTFSPVFQALKSVLIPDQQRQTLQLLAKVFIVMATRATRENAQKMLHRAEECFKDSIDDDKTRNDFHNMGMTCLQLAALYLMFDSPGEKQKSALMRDQGLDMMKLAASGKATGGPYVPVQNRSETQTAE